MIQACLNWFYMGGYAPYIWPAYASVLFIFVSHLVYAKKQRKQVLNKLSQRLNRPHEKA